MTRPASQTEAFPHFAAVAETPSYNSHVTVRLNGQARSVGDGDGHDFASGPDRVERLRAGNSGDDPPPGAFIASSAGPRPVLHLYRIDGVRTGRRSPIQSITERPPLTSTCDDDSRASVQPR